MSTFGQSLDTIWKRQSSTKNMKIEPLQWFFIHIFIMKFRFSEIFLKDSPNFSVSFILKIAGATTTASDPILSCLKHQRKRENVACLEAMRYFPYIYLYVQQPFFYFWASLSASQPCSLSYSRKHTQIQLHRGLFSSSLHTNTLGVLLQQSHHAISAARSTYILRRWSVGLHSFKRLQQAVKKHGFMFRKRPRVRKENPSL